MKTGHSFKWPSDLLQPESDPRCKWTPEPVSEWETVVARFLEHDHVSKDRKVKRKKKRDLKFHWELSKLSRKS